MQFCREKDIYGMVGAFPIGAFFNIEALVKAIDAEGAVLCKKGRRTKSVTVGNLFLKRYTYNSLWDKFRYNFITPRPWRTFLVSEILRSGKVETPEVFAALRRRHFLAVLNDFLVSAAIPENWSFISWKLLNLLSDAEKRELVEHVVKLLVKIHQLGVVHGDPGLRNFYFRRENGEISVGVADLDGASYYTGKIPEAKRCREIARIIVAHDGNLLFDDAEDFVIAQYKKYAGFLPDRKKVHRFVIRLYNHRKHV